jgi:hypothetical protein
MKHQICTVAAVLVAGVATAVATSVTPARADAIGPSQPTVIGYAAESGTYTSSSASWLQPTISCDGTSSDLAVVAALDGISDATIEEVGVEAGCGGSSGSTIGYDEAFYEFYPNEPVYLTNPVSPGDSITATITASGAGTFTVSVLDATKGWKYTKTVAFGGAPLSSAEVVAQDNGADFTSVTIHDALIDGAPLAAAKPIALGGNQVSPIGSDGESFTIYGSACTTICPLTS